MFEFFIEDVFKITGRGYVLGGVINDPKALLRVGETLIVKDNKEKKLYVNSIEMLNYGSDYENRRLDQIGILVDISNEDATEIKGKILIKETE
ncbi:hypothetical protein [Gorillibacterium massiliense]|uniref:hypothetical protein n=1 Tax=Gorillibacterium massiliense TaxID=1280390 RepID=UPI000594A7C3|nr:hypothetical protein [Gorillibacterium massiliense]